MTADDIGAAALDLRDALLRRREFVAQELDLLRHDGRELLQGVTHLGELALPRGQLLVEDVQALSLLQQRLLPPPLVQLGHQAPRGELGGGRDEPLDDADALALVRDLGDDVAELGLEALDLGGQAVALGFGAALLRRDLAGELVLLAREGGEDGGVDVLAVCGDAAGGHAQEGLALPDALALLDVDGGDGALLRHEDPRRAGRRRQVAGHRLLAGVLREEEEGDDGRGRCHGETDHEPGRQRLEQHHLAPLLAVLLEFNRFLTEQRPPW
jgi:hypothetical protein